MQNPLELRSLWVLVCFVFLSCVVPVPPAPPNFSDQSSELLFKIVCLFLFVVFLDTKEIKVLALAIGQMLPCNCILRRYFEFFKCFFWIAFSALTFHLLFTIGSGFWGVESNTSLHVFPPSKRKSFLLVSSSVLLLCCTLSAHRRWLTGRGILLFSVYWSLFPLGRWRGCIR